MSEQLDLASVMSTLRRRRRVIAAAGALGVAAGLLFLSAHPPLYSSSTLVLLPQQQNSNGQPTDRDMVTEAQVATSDVVLGRARMQVHPTLSRDRIEQLVTVDSPSHDMLQITGRGPTAQAAQELAQTVANSELAYQKRASSSLSNSERAAFDSRQTRLQQQLATVNREIQHTRKLLADNPPQSPQARAAQTALAQLTAQQSTLVLDIDGIRSQRSAQDAGPEATLVQGATPAKRPRLLVWQVLSALFGLLVGVGLAAVLSVSLARRDRRLRTRDEIADALGSPVLGSVKSLRPRTTAGWRLLLESYRPSTVDAWSLRQVLDHVGAGPLVAAGGGSAAASKQEHLWLSVVVVGDDPGALSVAGQLASHTASLGVSTRLTSRQRHAAADALWATSTMPDKGEEVRPGLLVDPRRRKTSADLVVELVVVDRQQPTFPDLREADAVVLVVSSGAATEEDLARVAVSAYEAGGRFRGVVVADPDTLDRTTGRLLQPERVAQPPMPMRLTGVESVDWRHRDGGRS